MCIHTVTCDISSILSTFYSFIYFYHFIYAQHVFLHNKYIECILFDTVEFVKVKKFIENPICLMTLIHRK